MSHILKSASNHENWKESVKMGQNNHLAKKEEFIKSRSEVIQKLVKSKEQEKEEALRREKEKKERKEKMQNTFRIPKKKPEPNPDVEKLINSLFDDTETPFIESQPFLSEKKDDKLKTDKDGSSKNHSSSSSHKEKSHSSPNNDLSRSEKHLKGHTSDKYSSSPHSNKDSKGSSSDKHSSSPYSHKDSKESPSDKHLSSSHSHKDSKESPSDKHLSSSHSHKDSKESPSDKHSSSSHSHKDSKGNSSDKHSSSSHSHKDSKGSSSDKHSSSTHSHKDSKGSSSDKHSSSSHSHNDLKGSSSDKHSSSSHSHKHSSSSHSHKDSKGNAADKHSSSSHSGHYKSPSDPKVSNSGHKSSDVRSSSSSRDHEHKPSSGTSKSTSGNSRSHDSERSQKDTSSLEAKHSSSKSQNSSKPKEPSLSKPELKSSPSASKDAPASASSGHQPSASDQLPVVLSKHHLNPTVERQANSTLSEKEKILARLQAIKQRTLEAIHKENMGKGRRGKGEKTHRKSSKSDVKHDDKTKSVEIVRDIVSSSEDEDELNNGVPSALDIMLSDRTAKLEKEKITRMAKQAWERAMKKDAGEPEKEVKVKKKHKSSKRDVDSTQKHKKSGNDDKKNHNKKKDSSLSPRDNTRKSSPKPRKPVIVRHSLQSAPPMDFKALLEMAEKKQKEPPKPLGAVQKKKKEEDERPLTQEEKDRKERKKTKEYQDWLKFGGKPPAKTYDSSDDDELQTAAENSSDKRQTSQHPALNDKNKVLSGSSKQSFNNKQILNRDSSRNSHQIAANGDIKNKPKNITVNENILVCGPGSDDEEAGGKTVNPFDRIMGQFQKKRPAQQSQSAVPAKKGRFLDSEEEEEDPDLDDFIDDGEGDEPDYSQEIKKIFGYDKSKYKYEKDEDLSDMEADYATVMKEEKRSAKLGLMEDLEDMRKEQEELKKKAMLKKRK